MARTKKTANGMNNVPNNVVPEQQNDLDVIASNNEQILAVAQQPKTEWFCCMLYPDDPKHEAMLTYIKSRMPEWAYILHDRDVVTDHDVQRNPEHYSNDDIGKPKKPHYHVAFKHFSKVRLKTVRGLFQCWSHGIQSCTDRVSYIYYWTHDDPMSRFYGKTLYECDEIHIHGVSLEKDIRQIKQNVDFVQFEEHGRISVLLQNAKITNTADLYVFLSENKIDTTLTAYELVNIVRGVHHKLTSDIEKVTHSYEKLCAEQYKKIKELERELNNHE